MITLKEWMEIVEYRITEGSEGYYDQFGDAAYSLSAWNGEQDGWSFNIVFDTRNQTVYMVEACDYKNQRAYRIINPDFREAYNTASEDEYRDQAWDYVNYVDLESDDDFIQKALSIRNGEDYDTRVSIPIDFTDEELLKYMTMAHERDMTFNQFVEEALQHAIDDFNRDPEGMKSRAEAFIKRQQEK